MLLVFLFLFHFSDIRGYRTNNFATPFCSPACSETPLYTTIYVKWSKYCLCFVIRECIDHSIFSQHGQHWYFNTLIFWTYTWLCSFWLMTLFILFVLFTACPFALHQLLDVRDSTGKWLEAQVWHNMRF